MHRQFTLEYWLDDDWHVGRLREIPGVFSQGSTMEELEENIQDVYELLLDDQDSISLPADVQQKEMELVL